MVSNSSFLPDWLADLINEGMDEEAWNSVAMFISSKETTRRMVGYCSITMLGAVELTGVTARVGILAGAKKLSEEAGGGGVWDNDRPLPTKLTVPEGEG